MSEPMKRQICSKESPRTDGATGQWAHPDAELLYDRDTKTEGSYERYTCPNCGLSFDVTILD